MGFLGWLSGPPSEATSKDEAKKRLQLTIFHDRMEVMELPPEKLNALRDELMEVIAKYFEIDLSRTECTLQQDEREVAFVANIPVKKIRSGH
ncbi:MAG: cell division topological specificity factor MinE [Candidatus Caenarcaniphilales bacterium]|nr:cell division topological specificity factor MinE [Candidatus Caenarcaniphilales bacterium]